MSSSCSLYVHSALGKVAAIVAVSYSRSGKNFGEVAMLESGLSVVFLKFKVASSCSGFKIQSS